MTKKHLILLLCMSCTIPSAYMEQPQGIDPDTVIQEMEQEKATEGGFAEKLQTWLEKTKDLLRDVVERTEIFIWGNNFHVVDEDRNIYRSKQLKTSSLKHAVDEHNFEAVITLRGEHPQEIYETEKAVVESKKAVLIPIQMHAKYAPSIVEFREILHAIKNTPKNYLFHDKSGANRTGLFAALIKIFYPKKDISHYEIMQNALSQLSIKYGYFWIFSPQLYTFAKHFGFCYLQLKSFMKDFGIERVDILTPDQKETLKSMIQYYRYFDHAVEAIKIFDI